MAEDDNNKPPAGKTPLTLAGRSAPQAPAQPAAQPAQPAQPEQPAAAAQAQPATPAGAAEGEGEGAAEDAKPKKRVAHDHFQRLDHFNKIAGKSAGDPDFAPTLIEKMQMFLLRIAQKQEEAEETANKVSARIRQAVLVFVITNLKWLIVAVVCSPVVVVALLILPTVPIQLQRSAGFTAFEDKNYDLAFSELSNYINERPNDYAAAHMAAQAALYRGDFNYAKKAFETLHSGGLLQNPDLPYLYALSNIGDTKLALDALNPLLEENPRHAPASILRALLISGDHDSRRRAREDMLRAEEVLRESDGDHSDVLLLHRSLLRVNFWSFTLDGDPLPKVFSQSEDRIGLDFGWLGYVNQYRLSQGEDFLNEEISPRAALLLYFSYVLMRQGDLEGAQNELREAVSELRDESNSILQARALLLTRQGKYQEAGGLFADLARQIPDDIETKINHAVALWAANPSPDNIDEVTSIYSRVLAIDGGNRVAANNFAFLRLLAGDHENAEKPLASFPEEGNDKINLNRAVVALLQDDIQSAYRLLRKISPDNIPQATHYMAELRLRHNTPLEVINMMREWIGLNPRDETAARLRARAYGHLGMWRIAYNIINEYREDGASLEEELGEIDAEIMEKANISDEVQKRALSPLSRYYFGKYALLAGNRKEARAREQEFRDGAPEDLHFADALDGARKKYLLQDYAAAAEAYKKALNGVDLNTSEGLSRALEYAAEWGELRAEAAPKEVEETLVPLLNRRADGRVAAALARALAQTDATAAEAALAAAKPTDFLYITQKNMGAALVALDKKREAKALLERARLWRPIDIAGLRLLAAAVEDDSPAAATTLRNSAQYLHDLNTGNAFIPEVSFKLGLPPINSLRRSVKTARERRNARTFQAALDQYEKAVDEEIAKGKKTKTNTLAQIYRSLASFNVVMGQVANAIPAFEQALDYGFKQQADETNTRLFYARVLSQTGEHDDALKEVDKVIAKEGVSPTYLRMKAEFYEAAEQQAEARAVYEEMATINPIDGFAHFAIANIDIAQKQLPEAAERLEMMLRIGQNYPVVYKTLSEVYFSLGETWWGETYLEYYEKALEWEKNEERARQEEEAAKAGEANNEENKT